MSRRRTAEEWRIYNAEMNAAAEEGALEAELTAAQTRILRAHLVKCCRAVTDAPDDLMRKGALWTVVETSRKLIRLEPPQSPRSAPDDDGLPF
jgi:hypothetical protein